jgi:hypothetical protein
MRIRRPRLADLAVLGRLREDARPLNGSLSSVAGWTMSTPGRQLLLCETTIRCTVPLEHVERALLPVGTTVPIP